MTSNMDTPQQDALERNALKHELKVMIIRECQKAMQPDDIPDDAPLFGGGAGPDLDSLDALQVAMAVHQRYGKRIQGNTETRSAMATVNALADFIRS